MDRADCARQPAERPRYELGDIVREHVDAFRAHHAVSPEQGEVLRALAACRTAALGGHLDRCLDCGCERPAYNSCRNRHCPKCQAFDQARWLAGRLETLLPVPYFHVVLTLPGELSSLVLRNRHRLFDLLFRAGSETILTLGRDPHRLGAQVGFTMVLHTWTRDLRFHPHLHAIVTGGGLSVDGESWIEGDARYLVPVRVLSALFRGKMLALLRDGHRREPLDLPGELADGGFERLLTDLYDKDWITYAKPPFAGPEQVFAYLGRYTHRVGLSNRRILDVTDESVTLCTRGEGKATMPPVELIRRFLLHVLPKGFVKIRHYGIVAAGNVNTKLADAQRILAATRPASPENDSQPPPVDWRTFLAQTAGIDARVCPACGSQRWVRAPLPRQLPARAPPGGSST